MTNNNNFNKSFLKYNALFMEFVRLTDKVKHNSATEDDAITMNKIVHQLVDYAYWGDLAYMMEGIGLTKYVAVVNKMSDNQAKKRFKTLSLILNQTDRYHAERIWDENIDEDEVERMTTVEFLELCKKIKDIVDNIEEY